jgi:hypothetical protein
VSAATFEGWAILELMGHRRMGGYVTEATLAGGSFLRIDVPEDDAGKKFTQFYPPASVYCMTPCSEEAARGVARANRPEPVHSYELAKLPAARRAPDEPDDDPGDEVCPHGVDVTDECDDCGAEEQDDPDF